MTVCAQDTFTISKPHRFTGEAASNAPVSNSTECVHTGVTHDPLTGALLTNIVQSTAFAQESVEKYLEKGYSYSRSGNPTVSECEKKIGLMEGSNLPAVCFSTGMAAVNALFASFLKTGDHVVITDCSYGGTNRAARVLYQRQYGIEFSFVDFRNLKEIEQAIQPGRTRLIISETPCNPTIRLADVAEISALARKFSKEPTEDDNEVLEAGDGPSWKPFRDRILHVCDSTMAPPVIMRALKFHCDVALISLTKYYCGHNQQLGGALVTNDQALYDMMKFKQNVMGSIMSPMTAYSIMQTSKTMALRVRQQSNSALAISQFLESHPKVVSVSYPGLASHEQHKLALTQHYNNLHGGMIAFEVKGGVEAARRVMNHTYPPIVLAENLGAVESILTCPAVFTHGNMPRELRLKVGITDGLMRLSVGIEDTAELIESLKKSLEFA